MEGSLLSTFQLCAAAYTSVNKNNGPQTFIEEIHRQLGKSVQEFMIYYNIGRDIGFTVKIPNLGTPESLITINSNDDPAPSLQNVRYFLNHVKTYTRDGHVRITYGGKKEIAQIFFDPKDMYYTLMYLRAKNFPIEINAIRHLNFAKHLIERVENYIPSHQLH